MAEKAIRIGLVGCGGMMRDHVRNFLKLEGVELAGLCDIVPAHAERLADEMLASAGPLSPSGAAVSARDAAAGPARPKPPIFDDFTKMLAAVKLDAVDLATPHTIHFPHALAALEAGLHVLVEKPMVTSSAHARVLREKVRAAGKVLVIAFQGAHTAEHAYARDLIATGQLGELRMIDGFVNQSWLEGTRGKWRQDPALSGGGFLYDSGAHLLNAMMWLVNSPAVEVSVVLDRRGAPVDIDGSVSIRFANGCLGSAAFCGSSPRRTWQTGITLIGARGILKLPTHYGRLEHFGPDGQPIPYPQVTQTHLTPQESFLRVIRGQDQPCCGVEFGVLLADLMDAIYESARTGNPARPRHGD